MSLVKSSLAVISSNSNLLQRLAEHTPLQVSLKELKQNNYDIRLLLVDCASITPESDYQFLAAKKHKEFDRVILLLRENCQVPVEFLTAARPDAFVEAAQLSKDDLYTYWNELSQKEQDETYLNLSAELNQQYELLKTELEHKLYEKSKNLIESRRQIFEINTRVEMLRKALFATTEVKSLHEAENSLNDLLVGFNLITWLKIITAEVRERFEHDISTQLDSHYYLSRLSIGSKNYYICFFKGDRRNFKKNDLNYFNKLTEALQINLNRYNNLLSLQQNERLFDLAFHSSPHPIIVIDDDYHIFQANLAAEKQADTNHDNLKCYELLFGRNKPCTGCHLGSRFEIQQDIKTYAVQSNKFDNQIESDRSYWIHLYEDVSEQKNLEKKFQQTARLSELGLISSSIAHELNNPLGGILSYLQIMKMELPKEHPFLQDIEYLTDTGNRMKKHIEDLLFFSRKEDLVKIEDVELVEVFQKNLDLLQMQLKKEHLIVSFVPSAQRFSQKLSVLHFRNSLHLTFQFFLNKLRVKRQNKSNFNGLVEVKIFQDADNSYVSFSSNLGPHDLKQNSNDLSLISLEKSILDQGFQLVITEPQPLWLQLLIKIPANKNT